MPSEKDFLGRCIKSSQEAYEAFKSLLVELESPQTRAAGLEFIHASLLPLLGNHSPEELVKRYHFSFSELGLKTGDGGETRLTLLQLPSTFAPEEWSFTFFEGLARYKIAEFQDRKIAEMGCGIGWISLALAKQTRPAKIYGLDINPRAITCSRINLYLNGFDRQGRPTWEHEGRTLADVVEFQVSDLLEYCRASRVVLDRVIGCIPQVLNPDPDFTARMLRGSVAEHDSDEFLYSLSNYAPQQGHLEDQFGLGLIARAVEESVDVLRSSGKLILNLGGRPGKAVLQRLFLRRGFEVRSVWNTRVSQAKDTDIQGLVAIEERSTHRFEFFIENGSGDAPVSARTALAFAEAGGEIAHGLSVYEARLRDPQHVPRVLRLLRQPGYEVARRAIDLSYTDSSLAEEKLSFLSELADQVDGPAFFPYEKTAGLESFRSNLASFFGNYFNIQYEAANFVVAPSAAAICRNLLALYAPKRALIDADLAASIGSALPAGTLEVPRSADLLCEMIEKLKPELVVYSMPEVEGRTRDSLVRILETAEKARARVFIDVSELMELSSTPAVHGVFRHLAKNRLPQHAALLCGLVKNRLYREMEVCFAVSENRDLIESLVNSAELTYSRTPVVSQLFYDRILKDLLGFQITENGRGAAERELLGEDGLFRKAYIAPSAAAETAFKHPAIQGEKLARSTAGLIRLDYGENSLPAPRSLKRALFESFAMMRITPEESDPTTELLGIAAKRFGLPGTTGLGVTLGGGVAPLFSAMAEDCARAGRTLVFPAGAYGYFVAAARFFGAKVETVPTAEAQQFKLTAAELDATLAKGAKGGKGAWVILSAPVVNPTGAIYSGSELGELMTVARKHGALIALDTIFSGLEFAETSHVSGALREGDRWAILGGLSKEFSAGGLRIGYGITADAELQSAWRRATLVTPHPTLRFALKRACAEWLRGDAELSEDLRAQRDILAHRATELSAALTRCGWKPLPPHGGLFMIATPGTILGKSFDGTRVTLENVADLLRERTRIVINTPGWTGIPGYFRFVLSVTDAEFAAALKGLQSFSEALK